MSSPQGPQTSGPRTRGPAKRFFGELLLHTRHKVSFPRLLKMNEGLGNIFEFVGKFHFCAQLQKTA